MTQVLEAYKLEGKFCTVPQNKKFAAKFSPEIQIILSSKMIKVGAELNINVCGLATTFCTNDNYFNYFCCKCGFVH
jgi:hypothetical protein